MKFPKRLKRHVLRKKGTKLTIGCDESCSLKVTLATKGGKALRSVTAKASPKAKLSLRVTAKKARRALKRLKSIRLTIVATDAAGNRRTIAKTIKLKR